MTDVGLQGKRILGFQGTALVISRLQRLNCYRQDEAQNPNADGPRGGMSAVLCRYLTSSDGRIYLSLTDIMGADHRGPS